MSAENKKNEKVGKTPMDLALEADDLTGNAPKPKLKIKSESDTPGKSVSPEMNRLYSEDLDDSTEKTDNAEDKKEEERAVSSRQPNNVETIAGILLGGGKMAIKGGVAAAAASKEAKNNFAKRTKAKQHAAKVKQLNKLAENTMSFRDNMVKHTKKYGSLSADANAYFKDDRLLKKYPDSRSRAVKSIEIAAKNHVGPDGDSSKLLKDFNSSYSDLKEQMKSNIVLTEKIAGSPKRFESIASDHGNEIELVVNNSMEALREAKQVKNVAPGEDENLQTGLKERMEELEKQIQAFLEKIKVVINKILGR